MTAGSPRWTVRRRARAVIETALIRSGVEHLALHRHHGDVIILAYHNIVPHGERVAGDRSLHLPQDVFAQQLDALTQTHRVVPLDVALRRRIDDATRPAAVITFDDAYAGAVGAGIDEVARRGLPATIFVSPAFLGGRAFWWDVLARDGEAGLSPAVRARALSEDAGETERVLARLASSAALADALPAHARAASLDALAGAASTPRVTLASHTWSHPNLAVLDAGRLDDELVRPLSWLREHFPNTLPYLSYPYGLASRLATEAARAAGYEAAVRIDGGWVGRHAQREPFAVPRVNIPAGVSGAGFRLRAAGLA